MARKKTDIRETVVGQLIELFFKHGYDGTTLSLISEKTGLHRASLYHHFPGGKEEMARSVIEYADRWGQEFIVEVVHNAEKSGPERLHELVRNLDDIHHSPHQLTPANAFVVGEAAELFAPYIRHRHYQGQVWLMTELLVVCGLPHAVAQRRAWEYRITWEGGLVCARVMGDMSLFRSLMQKMPDYLLSPADTPGILPADAPLPPVVPC